MTLPYFFDKDVSVYAAFQLTFPALDGIIYAENIGFPTIYILRRKNRL